MLNMAHKSKGKYIFINSLAPQKLIIDKQKNSKKSKIQVSRSNDSYSYKYLLYLLNWFIEASNLVLMLILKISIQKDRSAATVGI